MASRQINGTDIATATGGTITLDGSLSVGGAGGLNLALGGPTNLTLPQAGTLLAGTFALDEIAVGTTAGLAPLTPGAAGAALISNGVTAAPSFQELDVGMVGGLGPLAAAEIGQTLSLSAGGTLDVISSLGGVAGPAGPAGAQGPPGASGTATFAYQQGVAASAWTITHNLGKYPSAVVVDSAGAVVEGDIIYVSMNEIVMLFTAAFSGSAYLN